MSEVGFTSCKCCIATHELSQTAHKIAATVEANLIALSIVAPLFPIRQFLDVRRDRSHCLTVNPFCKTITRVNRQHGTRYGSVWLHRAKRGLSIFSLHGSVLPCGVR